MCRTSPTVRLLGVLSVALAAALIGFAGGMRYQRAALQDTGPRVPGLQDYQALAYFNHYSIVRANGPSMQPTLARWNFLLVRDTRQVRRGDILISGHHGMHRVLGLPGERIWLIHGRVRACTPRSGAAPFCRFLAEPYVRYRPTDYKDQGPILARGGYVTVPDNRACCQALIFVPASDVVGVAVGSLLSYGPLGPSGATQPALPRGPTLRYDR